MEAGKAAAHPEVEMIEGTGANADEDFVAAKLGLGDVGVVENGRVTVFLEDDRFHERPPRSEIRRMLQAGNQPTLPAPHSENPIGERKSLGVPNYRFFVICLEDLRVFAGGRVFSQAPIHNNLIFLHKNEFPTQNLQLPGGIQAVMFCIQRKSACNLIILLQCLRNLDLQPTLGGNDNSLRKTVVGQYFSTEHFL